MPGKSGRSLIFFGRVPYAHSTISSKLLGFAVSAIRPTLPPGHAGRLTLRILLFFGENGTDCRHTFGPTLCSGSRLCKNRDRARPRLRKGWGTLILVWDRRNEEWWGTRQLAVSNQLAKANRVEIVLQPALAVLVANCYLPSAT